MRHDWPLDNWNDMTRRQEQEMERGEKPDWLELRREAMSFWATRRRYELTLPELLETADRIDATAAKKGN